MTAAALHEQYFTSYIYAIPLWDRDLQSCIIILLWVWGGLST